MVGSALEEQIKKRNGQACWILVDLLITLCFLRAMIFLDLKQVDFLQIKLFTQERMEIVVIMMRMILIILCGQNIKLMIILMFQSLVKAYIQKMENTMLKYLFLKQVKQLVVELLKIVMILLILLILTNPIFGNQKIIPLLRRIMQKITALHLVN